MLDINRLHRRRHDDPSLYRCTAAVIATLPLEAPRSCPHTHRRSTVQATEFHHGRALRCYTAGCSILHTSFVGPTDPVTVSRPSPSSSHETVMEYFTIGQYLNNTKAVWCANTRHAMQGCASDELTASQREPLNRGINFFRHPAEEISTTYTIMETHVGTYIHPYVSTRAQAFIKEQVRVRSHTPWCTNHISVHHHSWHKRGIQTYIRTRTRTDVRTRVRTYITVHIYTTALPVSGYYVHVEIRGGWGSMKGLPHVWGRVDRLSHDGERCNVRIAGREGTCGGGGVHRVLIAEGV